MRRRAPALPAALATVWVALACATAEPAPAPEPRIEVVAHPRGESALPVAPGRIGARMATEPDLATLQPPAVLSSENAQLVATIVLASGALAVLGCPICLSNAVVAGGLGLLYLPLVAVQTAAERARIARIARALETVDFAPRVDEALRRFVAEGRTGARAPSGEASAEILVLAFGFAPLPRGKACFFLDARLRVANGSAAATEGTILLGPFRRSDDAPPPHCASRDALDADAGRLARRAAEESAEILAAIAARRLGESP